MTMLEDQVRAYAEWLEEQRDDGLVADLVGRGAPPTGDGVDGGDGGPGLRPPARAAEGPRHRGRRVAVLVAAAIVLAALALRALAAGDDPETRTVAGPPSSQQPTTQPSATDLPRPPVAPTMTARCDLASQTWEITFEVENAGPVAVDLTAATATGALEAEVVVLPDPVPPGATATAVVAGVPNEPGRLTFTITYTEPGDPEPRTEEVWLDLPANCP
jgi:hypothetical protein